MQKQQRSNRLINEKSPYLLQHALNPVDWYPWGEEAFGKARNENLPIFLSVGYSTCHWCHVMERESFENEETAEFLNTRFVPVKVDREENPDIDRIYMLFVQATTGSGGWPLSVWLTPALKPFYGGSYFPPIERWGRPSLMTVLKTLDNLWQNEQSRILDSAGAMMDQLLALNRYTPESEEAITVHEIECMRQLEAGFDPQYGGFGEAPKFPRPAVFSFLFSFARRNSSDKALQMVLTTLRKMAFGGIHDQLGVPGKGGGGFARYSTDAAWMVPHFEKMLYDNAQLASSYLSAFQATKDPFFAETARDIFNYVIHDLGSPEGAFYSAEDADSLLQDGSGIREEGAFYLWSKQEIDGLLATEESKLFREAYLVREEGNIPANTSEGFDGRNILVRAVDDRTLAMKYNLPENQIRERLERSRERLFMARLERPRPRLDDKVLASWNGLMISALVKGYLVLGDRHLLDAADRAATFILDRLYDSSTGRLMRRYRDGEAGIPAKADDYAFMIQAILDLYEASFRSSLLNTAMRLMDKQIQLFFDQESGGFYSTADDDTTVPCRLKDDNDGAEPSANSVSVMNAFRLGTMTGRDDLRDIGLRTLRYFSGAMKKNPVALPAMLTTLDWLFAPPVLLVLAGDIEDPAMSTLLQSAFRHDRSDIVVMHADVSLAQLLPWAAEIAGRHSGPPAVYLCLEGTCREPVSDPDQLVELLG